MKEKQGQNAGLSELEVQNIEKSISPDQKSTDKHVRHRKTLKNVEDTDLSERNEKPGLKEPNMKAKKLLVRRQNVEMGKEPKQKKENKEKVFRHKSALPKSMKKTQVLPGLEVQYYI